MRVQLVPWGKYIGCLWALDVNTRCCYLFTDVWMIKPQNTYNRSLHWKIPVQITCLVTERDILQIPYNKRRTLADCGFSSAGQNFGTAYLLSCKLLQLFLFFKKLLKLTFLKFVTFYNYVLYIYTTISYS